MNVEKPFVLSCKLLKPSQKCIILTFQVKPRRKCFIYNYIYKEEDKTVRDPSTRLVEQSEQNIPLEVTLMAK